MVCRDVDERPLVAVEMEMELDISEEDIERITRALDDQFAYLRLSEPGGHRVQATRGPVSWLPEARAGTGHMAV